MAKRNASARGTAGNADTEGGRPAGREKAFLFRFLLFVALLFLAVALKPVNDTVVEPFTAVVARAGGAVCRLFGEPTTMAGTVISSPRFAVNIRNGCNGLETVFIFAAAVLAFPAPPGRKALGLAAGVVLIQLFNLVRIVSLFFIGIHFPRLFEDWHTVVWQLLVILFGFLLFLLWASRLALPPRPARP